uniref:Uncharacterized protein n=1 Tax=Phytophthora ramorum TaxID=164328 RepID=H3H4Z3_PHYRM
MEDESLSSVDQFLRDNGLSISDPGAGLDSEDEDELLLSDADERAPPPTRSPSASPRFVLLEDEDLLLGDEDERFSGDRTSERRQDEQEKDSLDRSMLFGGSQLSVTPPRELHSVASSSSMLELQLQQVDGATSVYQMTPQQEKDRRDLVSAASSSVSSGRVLDEELNDALGVPRVSLGGRLKKQVE